MTTRSSRACSSRSRLRRSSRSSASRPEPSLVIANYSGWGPGQLEGEFNWDSWITLPATSDHVFWTGEKDLWKVVVGEVNAIKLSEFLGLKTRPADPRLN